MRNIAYSTFFLFWYSSLAKIVILLSPSGRSILAINSFWPFFLSRKVMGWLLINRVSSLLFSFILPDIVRVFLSPLTVIVSFTLIGSVNVISGGSLSRLSS